MLICLIGNYIDEACDIGCFMTHSQGSNSSLSRSLRHSVGGWLCLVLHFIHNVISYPVRLLKRPRDVIDKTVNLKTLEII